MPSLPYVLNPKGHFRVTTDALSALVCEKMELLPGNQPKSGYFGDHVPLRRRNAILWLLGQAGRQVAWQRRASERRQVLRSRAHIKTATRVKESWRRAAAPIFLAPAAPSCVLSKNEAIPYPYKVQNVHTQRQPKNKKDTQLMGGAERARKRCKED